MRKIALTASIAGALLLIPVIALAEEKAETTAPDQAVAGKGRHEMKMPPMSYPMPPMRNVPAMTGAKSMIATTDGGVAVMSGGKIYKFDRNLKMVGEAEIPGGPVSTPPEASPAMKKMTSPGGCCPGCPLMKNPAGEEKPGNN